MSKKQLGYLLVVLAAAIAISLPSTLSYASAITQSSTQSSHCTNGTCTVCVNGACQTQKATSVHTVCINGKCIITFG